MAAKKDYYDILGITKNSSEAEIKSAYRKLARKHHPDIDKSAGAAERFKEISEAYQVLSDTQKKGAYDQFGHAAFDRGAGGTGPFGAGAGGFNPFGQGGFRTYTWSTGGGGSNTGFDFGGFEDPFDLFEQIFGGASPFGGFSRRPTYQMNLIFDEAIKGVTKEIEIEQRNQKGTIERKRMKIKVPAGVTNGTKIRFGDIDIVFQVERHPEFIREGADVFSDIRVSIPQLVLGETLEVNTVGGKVKVKLPAATQPGSLVKLKGKGAPSLRGGYGDHYVRVNVSIPKTLSKQEKELYEKLKELSSNKKGWF
ncbi:DnaJ domain-containing protein [Candidatus Daviesbacteria bacterium]|nr:DnaJ domain-containing protein [Candidatus Daviesbacteria bacterium]